MKNLLPAIVFLLLAGCAEPLSLDPTLSFYSRDALKSGPITMPGNYNTDNYRKLLLGVVVNDIGTKAGEISPEIVQTLSSRLQTEMAKLKRFSVFSAHNRGGIDFFRSLSDVGDAKLTDEVDMRELDLVLSVSISVSKEQQDRYNDKLLIYEVECDFNCEEVRTHEVKFSEKATGRTARAVKYTLTGNRAAGYSDADERQAIYNAAMKALAVAANKLGNYYPVGGRITGSLGERMTLDKGFEHGVGKNMQMILYTRVDGVDLPLGVAEASPGTTTSNLQVWRWNTRDDYAEDIIDAMRDNPQKWLSTHDLYAVGYGMALPPDWETTYKDSFDEAMRAK